MHKSGLVVEMLLLMTDVVKVEDAAAAAGHDAQATSPSKHLQATEAVVVEGAAMMSLDAAMMRIDAQAVAVALIGGAAEQCCIA